MDTTATAPAPSLDDELLGPSEVATENSLLEKVRSSTRGVFEKYGVTWRAGQGRPRSDGGPKSSDVPLNTPASGIPANGMGGPAAGDPAYRSPVVKRCYKALAKALTGFADKLIFRKVTELSGDKEFARQIVLDIALSEPEADQFGELAAEIGAMLKCDEKLMVLAAAGATVCAVAGRYGSTIADLNKQLAAKRRKEIRPGQ